MTHDHRFTIGYSFEFSDADTVYYRKEDLGQLEELGDEAQQAITLLQSPTVSNPPVANPFFDPNHPVGSSRRTGTRQTQQIHTLTLGYAPIREVAFRLEMPFLVNKQRYEAFGFGQRPSDDQDTIQRTRGLGDIRLFARGTYPLPFDDISWDLYLDVGVKMPTGRDEIFQTDPNGRRIPVWASAQLGNGAWQPILGIGTRVVIGDFALFAQGQYMLGLQGRNDTPITAAFILPPFILDGVIIPDESLRKFIPGPDEQTLAVTDTYSWRVGFAYPALQLLRRAFTEDPIPFLDGSGISFAVEGLGAPREDLFGSDKGFRDTGDYIYATPGIFLQPTSYLGIYASFAIPIYRFARDRPQTVDSYRIYAGVTFGFSLDDLTGPSAAEGDPGGP